MARGAAPLSDVAKLVAGEMVAEVASVYVARPGDLLELAATEGLNPEAVGRTRLRVGEGIVGLCAAGGAVMNLPDAQNHPGFAYRPETGEEPYASMLAVPVRRAGRILGVLAVQNRAPRHYTDQEVEEAETVAMLLAELLAGAGAEGGPREGVGGALPRLFSGLALAGGIVLGPVVMTGGFVLTGRMLTDDPEAEIARLDAAAARMRRRLDEMLDDGRLGAGEADSRDVLEAYRLVAEDAGWLRRVAEVIRGGLAAEAAVRRVASELHERMRRIADPYLRERLADVEDLAGRLLAELAGATLPAVPPGAILIARRLGPAELLDWHGRGIAGVAIEEASPAGHAAILARALGLPALGGLRGVLAAANPGEEAVLDADGGSLILRPEEDVRRVCLRAIETRAALLEDQAALRGRPAITADGTAMRLMLNVGLALELDQLDRTGADGIGLFRTEIAMLARGTIPDTAEQAAFYARVLDAADGREVVFRTLDLGSDKLLAGAEAPEEANPAMGWRSLRVGLDRPAVLRRQLRALLLAAAGRPLSVMFPMVATVSEFRAARALLEAEARRVRPAPDRLQVGTMLEVPALAYQLGPLLEEADFLSIGSNDLLQFFFAADRGSPALAARYDLLSPPVFDLLDQVLAASRAARGGAGVRVSVCGEAAGRPAEAMVLAGLGLTSLSMPASGLLAVKSLLMGVDLAAFREVLGELRRTAAGAASLREPILAWARERGLAV
ncbi:MAG: GAF domain-containing protein [Rhodospirillales bacterium]|nr:GAF domain-containing protein [Rhodospirillales bacterium]